MSQQQGGVRDNRAAGGDPPAPPPAPAPPQPPITRWRRLRLWANMFFMDHGFIRVFYLNRHRVGPLAFRAAQPGPGQLRRFARDGVRTVINLRGGRRFGSYPLEVEACAAAGMNLINYRLKSRDLPTLEELRAARDLLAEIDYPVLFHCKSGADRAGLMSAIYLLLQDGAAAAAARQLSFRYGHVRLGKTGVLDAFIAAYARDTAQRPMDLIEWAETLYDRDAIKADFTAGFWGALLSEKILRRE